jgi:hypothetical protein
VCDNLKVSTWGEIKRVVKSNSGGISEFEIDYQNIKGSGNVTIKNVQITAIEKDKDYFLLKSNDDTVRIAFYQEIVNESGVDLETLENWVELLAQCRKQLCYLVGDKEPYNGVTDIIATEHINHYGLAGNPIYIDYSYVCDDLKSLSRTENLHEGKILSGYIHEISHTFDGIDSDKIYGNWNFDEEFFAELKTVYVLYKNGYLYDDSESDNVLEQFANSVPLKTGIFSTDSLLNEFLLFISKDGVINWEYLRNTFIDCDTENCLSYHERFDLFVEKYFQNSNEDFREFLSDDKLKLVHQILDYK